MKNVPTATSSDFGTVTAVKKFVALMLVLALVFGDASVALAAAAPKPQNVAVSDGDTQKADSQNGVQASVQNGNSNGNGVGNGNGQGNGKEKLVKVPKAVKKDKKLSDVLSGKKLERVSKSVKNDKRYALLVRSNLGIESVRSFFEDGKGDGAIKVEQVSTSSYLIKIPSKNRKFGKEAAMLDDGTVPARVGPFEVVEPTALESFGTPYLDGEETDNLWNMEKVGAPDYVEDLSNKARVKVAVIDTGIDASHPDLSGSEDTASYDFVNSSSGGIDDNGHGTEVAGVLGARVNGSGAYGANPYVDILSLKALDSEGVGSTYDVLEAIAYAKKNDVKVINMSFGGSGSPVDNPVCEAIADAKKSGIVTVVSAGNLDRDASNTIPAACPDAIAVGSTGKDGKRASFSNYGPTVATYAPGEDIYTTTKGGGYGSFSGTSFSAPLVAGLVAKEFAFGTSTADTVRDAVRNSYSLMSAGYEAPILPTSEQIIGEYGTFRVNSTSGMEGERFIDGNSWGGQISPNGTYFVHYNSDDASTLYKKRMDDGNGGNGVKFVDAYVGGLFSPDGNSFFYYGPNDGGKVYKKPLSANVSIEGEKFLDLNAGCQFSPDGKYCLYVYSAGDTGGNCIPDPDDPAGECVDDWVDNSKTYRKAMDSETAEPGALFFDANIGCQFSPDGKYCYYANPNHEWKTYRKAMNSELEDEGIGFIDTNVWGQFSPDGKYFVYRNPNDGWKLYRKLLSDTNVGYGTIYLDTETWGQFSPDGEYFVYQNPNDEWKIYRKPADSGPENWGVKFLDLNVWGQITPDSKYFVYQNPDDGLRPYRKPLSEANFEPGIKLLDVKTWVQISPDSKFAVYQNPNDNWKYYRKPISPLPVTNPIVSVPTVSVAGVSTDMLMGATSVTVRKNRKNIVKEKSAQSQNDRDGTKNVAADESDPVSLPTGEFTYDNPLLQLNGGGSPLRFGLNYRNFVDYEGPVGNKFTHNYNAYLTGSAEEMRYYDGKFGTFTFTASGSEYGYVSAIKARLLLDSDTGTYSIAYDDGSRIGFGSNLRISQSVDRYGNANVFSYDSDDRLTGVTDSEGRTATFAYNADSRLQSVTAPGERSITFEYYDYGDMGGDAFDLKTVTVKIGNESKTASFTYDSRHNIRTLVDSKGQTYVTNEFDQDGRVTKQTFGSGVTNYSYGLVDGRVGTNTVTNANGVKTKYSYDANGNVLSREIFGTGGSASATYSYAYDDQARLVKTRYPNGNGTTYLYDGRGNTVETREKTDADAEDVSEDLVTLTEYDGKYDFPVRVTHPNGLEKLATLDPLGNVVAETLSGATDSDAQPRLAVTSYAYSLSGQLLSKTDAEGGVTGFSYMSGMLSATVRGTGTTTVTETVAYDAYGNVASVTDGEGKTKSFERSPFGNALSEISSEGIVALSEYDANGNKTKEGKRSASGATAGVVEYAYDSRDRLIEKTERLDDSATRVTTYAYDGNGNVVSTRVGTGAVTELVYDEMNRVIEKRIKAEPNSIEPLATERYARDGNGNTLSKTDALGNVTLYEYDGHDRLIQTVDPLGTSTVLAYDAVGNAVSTETLDASGSTVSKSAFRYDLLGNRVETRQYADPASESGAVSATAEFDLLGRTVKTTDALGNVSRVSYDALGRVSAQTDALGNAVTFAYDRRGLVTGKVLIPKDGQDIATVYEYDADGRAIAETDALGHMETASYDAFGRRSSVTDAGGNRTDFAYDLAGRKTSETKYLADGTPVTTSYAYDDNDRVTSVTDAEGKSTLYSYDLLGRNVRVTYPDGTNKDFSYDANGSRTGETLARGTEMTTQYDALGRPVSRAATGSGIPVPESETYSYDPLGRLVSASSSGSVLSFSYDFLGRTSSETQDGKTVEYGYDPNGNRLSVSASGYLAGYSRDALGRIVSASLDGTGILDRSYSGTFLSSDSFWNGSRTDYSYDAAGRLTSLSRPGLPSASRNYVYSAAGNVTSDGLRTYSHDPLSRLVSAGILPDVTNSAGTESFGYGLTGNRTASESAGTSASYSGNLLDQYVAVSRTSSGAQSGTGTETYSYDADGNLASDSKFLYSYDSRNRLVSVKKTDGTFVAAYEYDPLGRRSSKTTNEGKTGYLYSGENAITETFAPAPGTPGRPSETSNLFGDSPDELLAYSADGSALADSDEAENAFCSSKVAPHSAEFEKYGWTELTQRCGNLREQYLQNVRKTYAVLSDSLGSPVALTDGSGTTAIEYAYSAFGEAYARSGTGNFAPVKETGTGNGSARLFAGREYDAETGLYYNRARTYSPELGRFLQRDPVGQNDQVNPYAYVANNPLGFTDPTGREKALIRFISERMNNYGIYLEASHMLAYDFMNIPLNPEKMNFKLNDDLLKKSFWTDPNCTDLNKNCGKSVIIDGMTISLAELGNIGYGYIARKYGYGEFTLKTGAMAVTAIGRDLGDKPEGILNNETNDWPAYDAGMELADTTETGKLTSKDLIDLIHKYKN